MFVLCQKCKKDVDPGLDRNTLTNKQVTKDTVARCPECSSVLPLSEYTLRSLVTLGQYHKKPSSDQAFSFDCKHCEAKTAAILSKDRSQALCSKCNKPLDVSSYMITAMKIAKNKIVEPA